MSATHPFARTQAVEREPSINYLCMHQIYRDFLESEHLLDIFATSIIMIDVVGASYRSDAMATVS